MSNQSKLRELVAFTLGEQEYCVDIQTVREIRGWSPTTPIPHSPSYVRGVINLRGIVLPIVDLAACFNAEVPEPSSRHVIVIAHVGEKLIGFRVDAVSYILTVGEDEIQPVPDIASEEVRQAVQGVIAQEDRMIRFIALDRVVPDNMVEAA